MRELVVVMELWITDIGALFGVMRATSCTSYSVRVGRGVMFCAWDNDRSILPLRPDRINATLSLVVENCWLINLLTLTDRDMIIVIPMIPIVMPVTVNVVRPRLARRDCMAFSMWFLNKNLTWSSPFWKFVSSLWIWLKIFCQTYHLLFLVSRQA